MSSIRWLAVAGLVVGCVDDSEGERTRPAEVSPLVEARAFEVSIETIGTGISLQSDDPQQTALDGLGGLDPTKPASLSWRGEIIEFKREFETFANQAEADDMLPDLFSFAQCSQKLGGPDCDGMNFWRRGGPKNGLIKETVTQEAYIQLLALQFFLKAYAKVNLGLFSIVAEKTLAKTSGFKEKLAGIGGSPGSGNIEVATHTSSLVACRDALDIVPSDWDRSACSIEVEDPAAP